VIRTVFGSAFRNSQRNVPAYLDRVAAYACEFSGDPVRVSAVEGDSRDRTRAALRQEAERRNLGLEVVVCEHGQREFGSTEEPDRLAALSKVGNAILSSVRVDDDVLVYVESDLMWDVQTIRTLVLLAHRRRGGFDVFSPMVMAGEAFYDIWGFRKDGSRFGPFYPYHPGIDHSAPLVEIDSAGSCLVMRGEVAQQCRIRNNYCLVGFCEDVRDRGFRIAACPQLEVRQA
jgi:hypothetical protein